MPNPNLALIHLDSSKNPQIRQDPKTRTLFSFTSNEKAATQFGLNIPWFHFLDCWNGQAIRRPPIYRLDRPSLAGGASRGVRLGSIRQFYRDLPDHNWICPAYHQVQTSRRHHDGPDDPKHPDGHYFPTLARYALRTRRTSGDGCLPPMAIQGFFSPIGRRGGKRRQAGSEEEEILAGSSDLASWLGVATDLCPGIVCGSAHGFCNCRLRAHYRGVKFQSRFDFTGKNRKTIRKLVRNPNPTKP